MCPLCQTGSCPRQWQFSLAHCSPSASTASVQRSRDLSGGHSEAGGEREVEEGREGREREKEKIHVGVRREKPGSGACD